MMPEGIRRKTVFLPAMTSVWPALWPPWKRTTPWAWSVSQSTILPLPSSPHCVPTTTTFFAINSILRPGFPGTLACPERRPGRAWRFHLFEYPHARPAREPAIACGLAGSRRLSGKLDDDARAPRTQARDPFLKRGVPRRIRREHAGFPFPVRAQGGELAQIDAEARGGTRAAERLADLVVAAAAADRIRLSFGVGREYHAAVIVITAQ